MFRRYYYMVSRFSFHPCSDSSQDTNSVVLNDQLNYSLLPWGESDEDINTPLRGGKTTNSWRKLYSIRWSFVVGCSINLVERSTCRISSNQLVALIDWEEFSVISEHLMLIITDIIHNISPFQFSNFNWVIRSNQNVNITTQEMAMLHLWWKSYKFY